MEQYLVETTAVRPGRVVQADNSDTRSGVVDSPNELCPLCCKLDFGFVKGAYVDDNLFVARAYEGLDGIDTGCPLCLFQREYNIRSGSRLTTFKFMPWTHEPKDQELFTPCLLGGSYISGDVILLSSDMRDEERLTAPHGVSFSPATIDFSLVRNWLRCCDDTHSCLSGRPSMSEGLSLKVLDCDTRAIVPFQSSMGRYVAMSYVWGHSSTDTPYLDDNRLGPLPPTLEDAVKVVQRLGYRYLWIDRYCIPQDDDERKLRQIQCMDLIYAQSALTLIAAAGEDPEYGLPGVSERARQKPLTTRIGDLHLLHIPSIKRCTRASTWASRGWTYQEGILTTRSLVFTDEQVYFQCQSGCALELAALGPTLSPLDSVLKEMGSPFEILFQRISRNHPSMLDDLIGEFRIRELSRGSDTLDAMKGVFHHFSHIRTLYGLPIYLSANGISPNELLRALILALSWEFPIRPRGAFARRPEFPSWTWAGWCFSRNPAEAFPWPSPPMGRTPTRYTTEEQWLRCKNYCSFEFSFGEKRFDWETNMETVLDTADAGEKPDFLEAHGWTFEGLGFAKHDDAHLCPDTAIHCMEEYGAEWGLSFYTKSASWLEAKCKAPMFQITFLVLTQDGHPGQTTAMILRRAEKPGTYERLGFKTISFGEHVCFDGIEKSAPTGTARVEVTIPGTHRLLRDIGPLSFPLELQKKSLRIV